MEPKNALLCSKDHATGPYLKPDESSQLSNKYFPQNFTGYDSLSLSWSRRLSLVQGKVK
jgi:hypothetical protein